MDRLIADLICPSLKGIELRLFLDCSFASLTYLSTVFKNKVAFITFDCTKLIKIQTTYIISKLLLFILQIAFSEIYQMHLNVINVIHLSS